MAWWGGPRGGWGRGGWLGPWPGRGPFSYLPPWQRPGWVFGRGACWSLFGMPGWMYWGYWRPWYVPWYPWGYGSWLRPPTYYYPSPWPAYPYTWW